MNEKQRRDAEILMRVAASALYVGTAVELLGVSLCHLRRLRVHFAQEGLAAVIHGNTGRARGRQGGGHRPRRGSGW